MGPGQIGIDGHIEPWRAAFDPAQHQMLDRIEPDGAPLQGTLDAGCDILKREALHEAQDLNELALASVAHTGLEQPPDGGKALRQVPIGQWGRLIQGIGLLLDQRQIMQRVEDEVLTLPRTPVPGDNFSSTGYDHLMHVATHQHLPVSVS